MQRRLDLRDATTLGVASMIGAGAFTVLGPATDAAGSGRGLLVALAVVAVVAWCNAWSSARLAARHPSSGGTYVYGRAELGPWWGFSAGWCFVVGKTASCAAMATAFAAYALPEGTAEPLRRVVAAAVVVGLTLLTTVGVTRTARAARAIVVVSLAGLLAAVVVGLSARGAAQPWWAAVDGSVGSVGPDAYGVAQAAGLLFFAFAGYARVATLGEEVRDPERTIPRAIGLAFAFVLGVYVLLALALLRGLGPTALAGSAAPLRELVDGAAWAVPLVVVGAGAASVGALLGLLAGIGRTALAMARDGELPRGLAALHPRHDVPHRAQLAVGGCVALLVLGLDLTEAVGFSSFGVLLYYLVANLAALAMHRRAGRTPAVAVIGALGCVALVATLPLASVASGVAVVGLGLLTRAVRLSRTRPPGVVG
ncbi:APC family permease [Nocardioides zeae]|uniref:APC family permease n=1 Tax=Nocardioides imazamoxiresistens TaxID=3231893 RepID=A0ABU3Q142_9ACTN|nr:APC family permease [Nocardioides zeae]MDT9594831.1 APC family permease [Nocardioides zeae]